MTADELDGYVRTVGARLDMHLMVDDPAAALTALPGRVARVTLQVHRSVVAGRGLVPTETRA